MQDVSTYWLANKEFKQPRQLRQIKRHFKINICVMVTILGLLLFARILYCPGGGGSTVIYGPYRYVPL